MKLAHILELYKETGTPLPSILRSPEEECVTKNRLAEALVKDLLYHYRFYKRKSDNIIRLYKDTLMSELDRQKPKAGEDIGTLTVKKGIEFLSEEDDAEPAYARCLAYIGEVEAAVMCLSRFSNEKNRYEECIRMMYIDGFTDVNMNDVRKRMNIGKTPAYRIHNQGILILADILFPCPSRHKLMEEYREYRKTAV